MKQTILKIALACCALGSAAANAGVIVGDATYGAYDNSSGTRLFNVTSHGSITDLNVTIDFSKCGLYTMGANGTSCPSSASHYPAEVEFRLKGSNGVEIALVAPGTYQNGTGTRATVLFDDEAALPLDYIRSGSFRPTQALSTFDGIDMFGAWTLTIHDTTGRDPLEYFSSSLAFNGATVDVPEPGTVAILGLGLAGLAIARRNRRA
jgi:hypothetical protein